MRNYPYEPSCSLMTRSQLQWVGFHRIHQWSNRAKSDLWIRFPLISSKSVVGESYLCLSLLITTVVNYHYSNKTGIFWLQLYFNCWWFDKDICIIGGVSAFCYITALLSFSCLDTVTHKRLHMQTCRHDCVIRSYVSPSMTWIRSY